MKFNRQGYIDNLRQQEKLSAIKTKQEKPYKPSINQKSEKLAKRVIEREQDDKPFNRIEWLIQKGIESKIKKDLMKNELTGARL